jgi:hypothetical protein
MSRKSGTRTSTVHPFRQSNVSGSPFLAKVISTVTSFRKSSLNSSHFCQSDFNGSSFSSKQRQRFTLFAKATSTVAFFTKATSTAHISKRRKVTFSRWTRAHLELARDVRLLLANHMFLSPRNLPLS